MEISQYLMQILVGLLEFIHVFFIRLPIAEFTDLCFIDLSAAEIETASALLKMVNNSTPLFVEHQQ